MNNTDKLLRAFIEASGFDIKEVFIKPVETEVSEHYGSMIINSTDNSSLVVIHGVYKRGGNKSYFIKESCATTDYKVTKREPKALKIHPDDLARLILAKQTGAIRIIE